MIRDVGAGPDGQEIRQITIGNGVLSATILTIGAAVQDLRLAGADHPLVLGYADPHHYLTNPAYLGVIVGRVANRISGAGITIGERHYPLDANEGEAVTLHGGRDGCSQRHWTIADHGAHHVDLCHTLPDGHMGFPGALSIMLRYQVEEASLRVTIEARSDAPTVCNLAPHFYFNLDGTATIDGHRLSASAERFIPVEAGVPVAGPTPVAGTAFDLRRAGPVPKGLDTHFCLPDKRDESAPVLRLETKAVTLTMCTTDPGVQIYDGSGLGVSEGLERRAYGPRAGVAIEPHRWIDAPNQPWRAQTDLRPGALYRAQSTFAFARSGSQS